MKKNIAVTVGLSLVLAGAPVMPAVIALGDDAPVVTEETPQPASAVTPADAADPAATTTDETPKEASEEGTPGENGAGVTREPDGTTVEESPEYHGDDTFYYVDKDGKLASKYFEPDANWDPFFESLPKVGEWVGDNSAVIGGDNKEHRILTVLYRRESTPEGPWLKADELVELLSKENTNSSDNGTAPVEEPNTEDAEKPEEDAAENKGEMIGAETKATTSQTAPKAEAKTEKVEPKKKTALPATGDVVGVAGAVAALVGSGALGAAARLRRRH